MRRTAETGHQLPTVFTRIIEGELPAEFVWQDERCVVFLSINPLARGHALVVPRVEIDHWIDLDDDLLAHLMAVARRVGEAQQRAFSPRRVGVIVAGYEVPHTHVHVVPTTSMAEMHFANAASGVDPAELERTGRALRAELGM